MCEQKREKEKERARRRREREDVRRTEGKNERNIRKERNE